MNYKHGSLENIILNAIWNYEETGSEVITVTDVHNKINLQHGQNWAYTTIKTVMDRLVEKGKLNRLRVAKKFAYKSVFSREELGRAEIMNLAQQYFNDDLIMLSKAVDKILSENSVLV